MTNRNIIVMPQSLSMEDMQLLKNQACRSKKCETIGELVYEMLNDLLDDIKNDDIDEND